VTMITGRDVALGANATSPNQAANTVLEYLRFRANLIMGAIAAANDLLNMTFIVGDEVIVNDQPISDAGRFPEGPNDFIYNSGALPGDRIILTFRETGGVAGNFFSFALKAQPA